MNPSLLPCVIFLDTSPVHNKRDLPVLFMARSCVQHLACGACHFTVNLKSSASFLPGFHFCKIGQKSWDRYLCFVHSGAVAVLGIAFIVPCLEISTVIWENSSSPPQIWLDFSARLESYVRSCCIPPASDCWCFLLSTERKYNDNVLLLDSQLISCCCILPCTLFLGALLNKACVPSSRIT